MSACITGHGHAGGESFLDDGLAPRELDDYVPFGRLGQVTAPHAWSSRNLFLRDSADQGQMGALCLVLSSMEEWHGPAGGHDHEGGWHRFGDLVEMVVLVHAALLRHLLDWAQRMQAAAAAVLVTLAAIQGIALSVVAVNRGGRKSRTVGFTGISQRVCLGMMSAWTIRGVQATRGATSPRRWPPPPRPTDLELWAAGQLTQREQAARAVENWCLGRPLEHNAGETQLPVYTIPAAPPEAVADDIDIARGHVTVWIAAPYYQPEIIDMEVLFPTTVARLNEAVTFTSRQFQDIQMEFAPTIPQLGEGYASYVAYPSWLPETSKVVQLIDAEAVGGGIFAAYVQSPLTRESILMNLIEGWPEGFRAYVGGSERPLRNRQAYEAVPGSVIKILGPGMEPRWCEAIQSRLQDPRHHAALPQHLDGLHTVYQAADDQVMEEIHSDDERTLEVSAEEALKYEHGEIWVAVPEDRLVDLAHLGRRIWGQVAVLDGLEQRDPTAPVVFVDVRGLALFPQWTQLETTVFRPVEYYETLDMPPLRDWTLLVVVAGQEMME